MGIFFRPQTRRMGLVHWPSDLYTVRRVASRAARPQESQLCRQAVTKRPNVSSHRHNRTLPIRVKVFEDCSDSHLYHQRSTKGSVFNSIGKKSWHSISTASAPVSKPKATIKRTGPTSRHIGLWQCIYPSFHFVRFPCARLQEAPTRWCMHHRNLMHNR